MSAAKRSSILRRGPASSRGSTDFISVKEDEPATMVPVVGTEAIVSIDLHAFWAVNPAVIFPCIKNSAEKCPGCEAGDKAGYRAYLPVLNGDGELRVFAFGISVERQFVTLEEELGDLRGLKLRVRRTGSGLTTKYQVVNTGKRVDVDISEEEAADFVLSKIDVKSRSEILEEMYRAGLTDDDGSADAGEEEEEIATDIVDEEEDEPVSKAKAAPKGKAKVEAKAAPKGKAKTEVKKGKKFVDEDENEWDE